MAKVRRRLTGYLAASFLGFAAVVEMSHFRRFEARRDPRVVTTFIAAIVCLYMASESLEGKWPSW